VDCLRAARNSKRILGERLVKVGMFHGRTVCADVQRPTQKKSSPAGAILQAMARVWAGRLNHLVHAGSRRAESNHDRERTASLSRPGRNGLRMP
jgi:hypothetical protein